QDPLPHAGETRASISGRAWVPRWACRSLACRDLLANRCRARLPLHRAVQPWPRSMTGSPTVGRDRWQKPHLVVRLLDVRPGSRVADLGAGGGYFTFRLADAVGPAGTIYAVDVDEGLVEYLRGRAFRQGRRNVVAIRAVSDDPRLPADGVDLVFTCNTYHHLTDRTAYFARLRQHLRPGGRVAVIDHTPEHGWLTRLFGHGTAPDVVR